VTESARIWSETVVIIEEFQTLVNPETPIPPFITN
jgi:DNA polymerase III epsilon subunit-like protein